MTRVSWTCFARVNFCDVFFFSRAATSWNNSDGLIIRSVCLIAKKKQFFHYTNQKFLNTQLAYCPVILTAADSPTPWQIAQSLLLFRFPAKYVEIIGGVQKVISYLPPHYLLYAFWYNENRQSSGCIVIRESTRNFWNHSQNVFSTTTQSRKMYCETFAKIMQRKVPQKLHVLCILTEYTKFMKKFRNISWRLHKTTIYDNWNV